MLNEDTIVKAYAPQIIKSWGEDFWTDADDFLLYHHRVKQILLDVTASRIKTKSEVARRIAQDFANPLQGIAASITIGAYFQKMNISMEMF